MVKATQPPDMSYVIEIRDEAHRREVLSRNQGVVIKVYADWCGPCKTTDPQYGEMAKTYSQAGRLVFCKEHADKQLSDVRGLPTFLFYRNSNVINQVMGADMKQVETYVANMSGGGSSSSGVYNQSPYAGSSIRKGPSRYIN